MLVEQFFVDFIHYLAFLFLIINCEIIGGWNVYGYLYFFTYGLM